MGISQAERRRQQEKAKAWKKEKQAEGKFGGPQAAASTARTATTKRPSTGKMTVGRKALDIKIQTKEQYEANKAAEGPRDIKVSPTPTSEMATASQPEQTWTQKAAEWGLKPAEWLSENVLQPLSEKMGIETNPMTAEEFSRTWGGEKLGFGTVALGVVAAALIPLTLTGMGKAGAVGADKMMLQYATRQAGQTALRKKGMELTLKRAALNTKSVAKVKSLLSKVILQFKKPAAIKGMIFAATSTYIISEWAGIEGGEAIGMALRDVKWSDDPELIKEIQAVNDEVFNKDTWGKIIDTVQRAIPGLNLVRGFKLKSKGILVLAKVSNAAADDKLRKIENPELTDDDIIRDRMLERSRLEKEDTDYTQASILETNKLIRAAEKAHQRDMADMWRAHKAEILKMEKEHAEWMKLFWLEYFKEKSRLKANSMPSALNFGLL